MNAHIIITFVYAPSLILNQRELIKASKIQDQVGRMSQDQILILRMLKLTLYVPVQLIIVNLSPWDIN